MMMELPVDTDIIGIDASGRSDTDEIDRRSIAQVASPTTERIMKTGESTTDGLNIQNDSGATSDRRVNSLLDRFQSDTFGITTIDDFITNLRDDVRLLESTAIVWNGSNADGAINEDQAKFEFIVDSASKAAGLFSLGVLVWVLRGSALVTAIASGGSSWRIVDPNQMLSAFRNKDATNEGNDLESMIKK
jgi:hypothetical protein